MSCFTKCLWCIDLISNPGECFTKTKVDFKLNLTMAGCSCQCLLSPFTGISPSRDVKIIVSNLFFFNNSLLKEKTLSKDHNGESNQWHEWSAIIMSNLKSILVFLKQPQVILPPYCTFQRDF